MSDTTTKTGKYGEPWEVLRDEFDGWRIQSGDRRRDVYSPVANEMEKVYANRAAACVNALESIPDPAKFVEVFGQMREALEELYNETTRLNDPQWDGSPMQKNCNAALAAAKEVMP